MNSPEKYSIECVEDFVYIISQDGGFVGKRNKLLDLRQLPAKDEAVARDLIANFEKLFKLKVHY